MRVAAGVGPARKTKNDKDSHRRRRPTTLASLRALSALGYEAVVATPRRAGSSRNERSTPVLDVDARQGWADMLPPRHRCHDAHHHDPGQASVDMAVRDRARRGRFSEKPRAQAAHGRKRFAARPAPERTRCGAARPPRNLWKSDAMRKVMARPIASRRPNLRASWRQNLRACARRPRSSSRRKRPFVTRTRAVPMSLSSRNCSGMRRARSPAQLVAILGNSSRRMAARCSSTRSGTCRLRCKPSCCECCRKASWSGSAANVRSLWTRG